MPRPEEVQRMKEDFAVGMQDGQTADLMKMIKEMESLSDLPEDIRR